MKPRTGTEMRFQVAIDRMIEQPRLKLLITHYSIITYYYVQEKKERGELGLFDLGRSISPS